MKTAQELLADLERLDIPDTLKEPLRGIVEFTEMFRPPDMSVFLPLLTAVSDKKIRAWKNPIDVAVGLLPVHQDGKIGLVGVLRGKATDAGYNMPALVGGFVGEGESIEEAMAREAKEEINFVSLPARWELLYTRHVEESNINLVFLKYDAIVEHDVIDNVIPNEEVKRGVFITEGMALAFPFHEEAVRLFYSRYS